VTTEPLNTKEKMPSKLQNCFFTWHALHGAEP